MQRGDGAGQTPEGATDRRPFTIERAGGALLAACGHGAIAYAMYRAARDEFPTHRVILRRQGEPLA